MVAQREEDHRKRDEAQNLAIQKLQIEAEAKGRAAGTESGKVAGKEAAEEATKGVGGIAKSESAKYSMILTTILIGLAEFIRIYLMNT
jgi:hypothetical protein